MKRILLTTIYRPFCVDEPFDSPHNHIQHATCHRQFTREQGIFTIHQQCSHLALHLIAANINAETDILEYPSIEEFSSTLRLAIQQGKPYDYVGVSCVISGIRKARHLVEITKELSPGTETVLGGAGTLAIGELIERFADHICYGDGISFLRGLLGQSPDEPLFHPVVKSIHFHNMIMGNKANPLSYSLAVSLGCARKCEFCSTSAQFGGRRIPVLKTGEEIFAAMKRVDADLRATRGAVPQIFFIIFDENFLSDEQLPRQLLPLSRQQLQHGTQFLSLLFADAENVSRYSPEELLEMGVDSLWIGMETTVGDSFAKNRGVDFRRMVQRLQENGIKVFISFIAGLQEQTRASIRQDIEYALTLEAAGFQYAIASPVPGTKLFERLKSQGRLAIERPEQINMSHYYVRHDELDEALVRSLTNEFQRRDYERNGPLSLRYMKLRLRGYRRHRGSKNPVLRARARGFRNDLMDAAGILSVGPVFAPTPAVKAEFLATRQKLREEVKLLPTVLDLFRGRVSRANMIQYLIFGNRIVEPAARLFLIARALRSDPRSRERCSTIMGLMRHGRACIKEVSHGVMPWDQPRGVKSSFAPQPRPAATKEESRPVSGWPAEMKIPPQEVVHDRHAPAAL